MELTTTFPYRFVKKVGEGGFGRVYKVRHKQNDQMLACKLVRSKQYLKEIDIMIKLKEEKNVINFHECYHYGHDKTAIIMELCNGSNILDTLLNIVDLDERAFYRNLFILQCINAIQICHENGIIHRDIKHTNFILKENTPESLVKLIDFGLSEYDFGFIPFSTRGTLRYIPPEGLIINRHSLGDVLTPAYDIWSLGIMIYLLYTGIDVFRSRNNMVVINNVRKGIIHNSMQHTSVKNTKIAYMITRMLRVQPMMRPNIYEVHEQFLDIISSIKQ